MLEIKMSDVAEQIRGVSYKPEDILDGPEEGAIGILRANNISEGVINFDDLVFVRRGIVSRKQILRKGDILICASSGSKHLVGKAAQVEDDCEYGFGAFCKVVRPQKINPLFLGMYFQSNLYRRYISGVSQGANINNIKNEHIDEISIRGYSDTVQAKIAKLLQKIINIIRLQERQVDILDKLIKSRFVEMFGDENNSKNWDIVNVEEVAEVQVGVVIKPSQYYTDEANGVKAFRSLNIGAGHIKDVDWVYFTEEGHQKNSKSILKENDLLIVRSGAPGTACVVTKEYEGCNAIDIIIARPHCDKVNPYFLCYFTNMPHGKRQIDEGTGGAAQQHFNVGKYNKLQLMLPPMRLQDKFAAFVRQVDKSKFSINKSLERLQLLFDSLMQKYFG